MARSTAKLLANAMGRASSINSTATSASAQGKRPGERSDDADNVTSPRRQHDVYGENRAACLGCEKLRPRGGNPGDSHAREEMGACQCRA